MPLYNEKGALVVSSGFGDRITDLDGDTYVIAAEEYIDFFADGSRYQRIDANGVQPTEYIAHYDDLDTYLRFTEDRLRVVVGGVDMIDITEAGVDFIEFNAGETDVDIIFNTTVANTLFLHGADGNVGIGTAVFGANSAIVLGFVNTATDPTNSANLMHIYCDDRAAGIAEFCCYQEEAIVADADESHFSQKWPVRINGTEYFIMMTTV